MEDIDDCCGLLWASPVAQSVKNLPAVQETWVRSLGREDPLEKEMATHSTLLPRKSHGQRSLVGCIPWGRKELGHEGQWEHVPRNDGNEFDLGRLRK